MWYHPNALGNVLSLALIKKKCRVVMDTYMYNNLFYVYTKEDEFLKFKCVYPGLYVYNASTCSVSKLRKAFSF